jgi:hypothetical protein
MDYTIFNIISFILTTMFYYFVLKPKLTIETLSNQEAYKDYTKSSYFRLCIYFLLVLLIQFGMNTGAIISKCGGSVPQNIGVAGMMTFLPWVLIFGLVIIMLIIFPGFKGAFSDVVGYFFVSNGANRVLSDILISTPSNMNNKPGAAQEWGAANEKTMQDTADVMSRLYGNMSILINQIVPSNFLKYMEILKPIMKPKYVNDQTLFNLKEQELLNLVSTRDNVGEAFWYTYAGLLLIAITQYNIASRPCVKDIATIQANYKNFLKDQDEINSEKARGKGVYTIKN